MKGLKLKLGRFDQHVTYMSDSEIFRSPVVFGEDDLGQTVFYLKNEGGPVLSAELDVARLNTPVLVVGGWIDNGRISVKQCLDKLLSLLELRIFAMIETILRESKIKESFKDIFIMVGGIEVFDNDEDEDSDGCYGWAKVSIAITD